MYAICIFGIKEIIEYGNFTAVPMMPDFIRGVINLRGAAVPVVDMTMRFGRTTSEVTRRSCIVIIEIEADEEKQDAGVVVGSVSKMLEIPAAEIEPAPSFGSRIQAGFMSGMGKIGGKFVIIFNTVRMLSVGEMAMLSGAKEINAEWLSASSNN